MAIQSVLENGTIFYQSDHTAALMEAIYASHEESVRMLLEKGALVNRIGRFQGQPLLPHHL